MTLKGQKNHYNVKLLRGRRGRVARFICSRGIFLAKRIARKHTQQLILEQVFRGKRLVYLFLALGLVIGMLDYEQISSHIGDDPIIPLTVNKFAHIIFDGLLMSNPTIFIIPVNIVFWGATGILAYWILNIGFLKEVTFVKKRMAFVKKSQIRLVASNGSSLMQRHYVNENKMGRELGSSLNW